AWQHHDGMLDDGQCVRRRVLGRRHVSVLPAEGPWPSHWIRGTADHAAEPDVLPFGHPLGLVRRPLWTAIDADDHRPGDDSDRTALPAPHRLYDDRRVLPFAGLLGWGWHAHKMAALSL